MRSILKISAVIAITVTFTSCSFKGNSVNSMDNKKQIINSKQSTQVNTRAKIPSVEEVANTLSSDEFQRRLVDSEGNEKATEYISGVFKTIGLETLFEDSYYQNYYQVVLDTYGGDISNRNLKLVSNVVGIIKGKEGKRAMVVSAHFDHIGYKDGKLIKGALDNASGVAALA
ncbi:M28 family peptidase [Clostridium bovifaecis]|uniref:M28 family peptidase n=1 Tax=Clostridium bovifaecis TaxID=2184719 RepID=A0A6I6ERQ2_9CLOT|nr:M28 family peptidase [Clostridium bovifaecis]